MGQDWPPSDEPDAVAEPVASDVLRSLASGRESTISFGDLVAAAGARVHGLILLLLVLPETLPLPLPSASTILAPPLMLISLHLALFGENGAWPGRMSGWHVPRSTVAATARYLVPVLRWLEAMSRPRWAALARRERLIGLACLYLSAMLFLPIPLLNTPPAICLALIALGLIQRDGLIIALGLGGTLATTLALAWLVIWAGGLFGSA